MLINLKISIKIINVLTNKSKLKCQFDRFTIITQKRIDFVVMVKKKFGSDKMLMFCVLKNLYTGCVQMKCQICLHLSDRHLLGRLNLYLSKKII